MISKQDGSEDRAQNATLIEPDWPPQEERRLLWKLDMRVLFPCCIIYMLAYLDRANLGNVKIVQAKTPDSLEESLRMLRIPLSITSNHDAGLAKCSCWQYKISRGLSLIG